jgi:hypothetical protein
VGSCRFTGASVLFFVVGSHLIQSRAPAQALPPPTMGCCGSKDDVDEAHTLLDKDGKRSPPIPGRVGNQRELGNFLLAYRPPAGSDEEGEGYGAGLPPKEGTCLCVRGHPHVSSALAVRWRREQCGRRSLGVGQLGHFLAGWHNAHALGGALAFLRGAHAREHPAAGDGSRSPTLMHVHHSHLY